MTLYGLDSAYAPSLATARRLYGYGWRFFGGYTGGPRAAHGWSNADFGRLARVGFRFIPIFVGRNLPWDEPASFNREQGIADGDDSNNLAGACGFDSDQAICLDVEANSGMGNLGQALLDYVDGWCQRSHDAGHKTIVYTSASIMITIGSHFDYQWGAEWVGNGGYYTTPPFGRFDPSEPPPWTFWQFADNAVGGAFDASSAINDAPLATYTAP
jgi:hypothetical protein